jgi:hypothetical protein
MHSIIAHVGRGASFVLVTHCGIATLLANVIDELDSLTQAVKVQQVWRSRRKTKIGRGGVVRPAHRDRDVKTVGESDDEIRIDTTADANNLDLLAV